MKSLFKNILKKLQLYDFVYDLSHLAKRETKKILFVLKRRVKKTDKKIIDSYFRDHELYKLHIGCGKNRLEGWLNSDYYKNEETVLHLDATSRFDFEDETFDFVFSEHMIEHISYRSAIQMLGESFRVLKKKGKIRLSTPDLAFLFELYNEEKTQLQKDFIEHATNKYIRNEPYCENICMDTLTINNYVRAWNHTFIYDEKLLRLILERIGYTNVQRVNILESTDPELANLENTARKPEGLVELESLILEAIKP